jgi:hypothetical protein
MAERTNARLLKSREVQASVGSNPTPSALEVQVLGPGCGCLSGFGLGRCLKGMHIAYLVVTGAAALMNGFAASMNFVGAKFVRAVADTVQVSQKWMVPLGTLLAAGAAGLLIGIVVPALGAAAAIGLVTYFICALQAHFRVRDYNVSGAITFLLLAIAALVTNVGYHQHW